MPEFFRPYLHLESVLTADDIGFLRASCKQHLSKEGMPCYGFIDALASPTFLKIKHALEKHIGDTLYYLNDFYIYTDGSFKTGWHMDTELFTFDRAVNAWILLSPDAVDGPLGLIGDVNQTPEDHFHNIRIQEDRHIFENFCTGKEMIKSLDTIESGQIQTPAIKIGDILAFDPKQFHRTNVDVPKHAIAFKFLLKGSHGFLSSAQVDPYFWPEVGLFNALVKGAPDWNSVIHGVRQALATQSGREQLSAGFYPAQFDLYRKMAAIM